MLCLRFVFLFSSYAHTHTHIQPAQCVHPPTMPKCRSAVLLFWFFKFKGNSNLRGCFGSASAFICLYLLLSFSLHFYLSFTHPFTLSPPSLSLSLSALSSAWALLARAHSARCCLGPRLVCATPPLTCTFAACLLSPSASYGFKRGRRLVVRHAAPPQINQQHVARCDSSIASGSPRRGRFCFIFAIYNIYRYIYMNI